MAARYLVICASFLLSCGAFAQVNVSTSGVLFQVNDNRFTARSEGAATVNPPVLYVAVTTGWDFACPFHGVPPIRMAGQNVGIGSAKVNRNKEQEINPGYGNWVGGTADCTLAHRSTAAAGEASIGFQYQGIGFNYSLAPFNNQDDDTEVRQFTKSLDPPPPPVCPCDWNPEITCQIP